MTLTRTANLKRTAAALLALLGWITLGIGYARFVGAAGDQGLSSTEATVRFFSFFTIQTNILAALVLSAFAIKTGPEEWLVHPFVRSAVAAYIVMVGIIYHSVLRPLEPMQNVLSFTNIVMHYLMPVAYLLFWLTCVRKAGLRWYDPLLWLIYPLFYLGFVLVRGKMSGFYPYPFIDAKTLGYAGVAANTAGLLIVCAAIGMCLVMTGWWLARRQPV
ncbi:MAG: Pr6Pr family membrane protein [Afipia sp.]